MYIDSIPDPYMVIFTSDTNIPRLLYYLHVPSMVGAVLMGIFIYFRAGRSLPSKMLLCQFLAFFSWCLADLIAWVSNDTSLIMFAWLLFYPLGVTSNIFGWLFLRTYFNKKDLSFKSVGLFFGAFVILIFLSVTGYALKDFDMRTAGATESLHYTIVYYAFDMAFSFFILGWVLLKRKDVQPKEKPPLLILGMSLFGFLFFYNSLSAIASFLVLTGRELSYNIEPYGLLGMPVYLGAIAYCMAKYNLFGIKLKETRILITAILIFIAAELSFMEESEERWFVVITLLVCAMLGYFLLRIIQAEEKRKLIELENINKELEQKNIEVEKANRDLQKLDTAKTEFINIASHQLRSPLTIVKGVASLLVSRKIDQFPEEDKQQFYNSVWSKCLKLENIIDDILNAAEFTNKKFSMLNKAAQKVEVKELLEKIVADLSYEIQQRELQVQVQDKRKVQELILAQKEYLEEAFINLLTNAIKYTPSTRKTDDVRTQRNEPGKIKIIVSEDNTHIEIKFQDNGIGISADEVPHLFSRFYRAENARVMYTDGTGLGLFIVKEIIEGHGGKISVESQVNEGTTFLVHLPKLPSGNPDIREYILEHSQN